MTSCAFMRDLSGRCFASAGLAFVPAWVQGHQLAATAAGKPLVLEEFGKV